MPHVASKMDYWYVSLLHMLPEVILKIKMKWGKHTLIKGQYSRTEKNCPWERAERRVKISTRRKRMPRGMQDPKYNDIKGQLYRIYRLRDVYIDR